MIYTNKLFRYAFLGFGALCTVGLLATAVYAAFTDKGTVLGSSFSVGNADIKLVKDLSLGTASDNLADELPGPSFTNIGQNWVKDYFIKIYNNGTYQMQLVSRSNYETINDPDDLRQYIFVEFIPWTDSNNNGSAETEELGTSLGKKTIIKWKTEGYDLGVFEPGQTMGYLLRFSTESISDTKQGKSALYDFEFDSLEQ